MSKCIKSFEVIVSEELRTEAMRKLEVENFLVIIVADCHVNNLYESAIKEYADSDSF